MAALLRLNDVSLSIIWVLLLMSMLSWYLIIAKTVQLGWTYWRSQKTLRIFWQADSVTELLSQLVDQEAFSNVAWRGIKASCYYEKQVEKPASLICSHSEFITRHLRRAMVAEITKWESGLAILATVSSTAPFIGLLGTVLGIYDALLTIGAQGRASLETVATPVGEALVMTALGLAVAIPAGLGYNALVRGQRSLVNRLEEFVNDLHTYLNTGGRLDSGPQDLFDSRIRGTTLVGLSK